MSKSIEFSVVDFREVESRRFAIKEFLQNSGIKIDQITSEDITDTQKFLISIGELTLEEIKQGKKTVLELLMDDFQKHGISTDGKNIVIDSLQILMDTEETLGGLRDLESYEEYINATHKDNLGLAQFLIKHSSAQKVKAINTEIREYNSVWKKFAEENNREEIKRRLEKIKSLFSA